MARIFDPTQLAKFGGLALVARQVVEGFLTGIHRSPFKGFSIEFAEHRPYYPGDEIRRIDWRIFGKTDRYYIKEYEDETNLNVTLIIDASASMKYRGKAVLSKWQYAQHVAASMAYLLLSQLDAVGMFIFDSKIRSAIEPKTTSKHLLTLLDALQKTEPGGETAIGTVLQKIAVEHLHKRGLVMILSDGLDQVASLQQAFRLIRHRKQEVIFFHILTTEEMDFPFDRTQKFRNLESITDEKLVDARRMREEYLRNFREYQVQLRQLMQDLQIDYQLLRTDVAVERALGSYLARRRTLK